MRMIVLTAVILIHSWYPPACCEDHHCHPVPCDQLRLVHGGWLYRAQHNEIIFSSAQPSLDGACHVCVTTTADGRDNGLCLFLPQVNS